MINYKEEVLKVYPNAVFWRLQEKSIMGAIYMSIHTNTKLSHYSTELLAWQSAYNNLKKQGKL